MVASSATTRRSLALTVPSTAASSNAVGRAGSASGRSELTIRGEPAFRARIYRATTLYSVGPRTRTMMQSCASVAKLRSGGPILCYGVISHGVPSGHRHLEPSLATRHEWTDWAKTVGCLLRPPVIVRDAE